MEWSVCPRKWDQNNYSTSVFAPTRVWTAFCADCACEPDKLSLLTWRSVGDGPFLAVAFERSAGYLNAFLKAGSSSNPDPDCLWLRTSTDTVSIAERSSQVGLSHKTSLRWFDGRGIVCKLTTCVIWLGLKLHARTHHFDGRAVSLNKVVVLTSKDADSIFASSNPWNLWGRR